MFKSEVIAGTEWGQRAVHLCSVDAAVEDEALERYLLNCYYAKRDQLIEWLDLDYLRCDYDLPFER